MNFNSGLEYELNTEYRQRNFAHLINVSSNTSDNTSDETNLKLIARTLSRTISIVLVIVALLFISPMAQAQMMQDSDADSSPEIELALIMGAYHFNQGRYEQAVEQFELASVSMPDKLFELQPEQAIVFWQLGEAQEATGQLSDALNSYLQFLELAGENATDLSVQYVAALQHQLENRNL